jgi:hypothetical protein
MLLLQAVNAASAIVEGTLDDGLAKFLKKNIVKKELKDEVGARPPFAPLRCPCRLCACTWDSWI